MTMQQKPCTHTDQERAFISVYTLQEIAYAETIGYQVLNWYEVYAYDAAEPLFQRFLHLLGSYKVTPHHILG